MHSERQDEKGEKGERFNLHNVFEHNTVRGCWNCDRKCKEDSDSLQITLSMYTSFT